MRTRLPVLEEVYSRTPGWPGPTYRPSPTSTLVPPAQAFMPPLIGHEAEPDMVSIALPSLSTQPPSAWVLRPTMISYLEHAAAQQLCQFTKR